MAKKKQGRRLFSDEEKKEAYEKQNGKCAECDEKFPFEEMEGDHKQAYSKGGKTKKSNLQMLCEECNQEKGAS